LPTRHKAGVRHDRPCEGFSRAGLDRFHGGEVFTGKSEEVARVTMHDLGNLVSMLPDHFPALAQIRDVRGGTEIGPKNLVAHQDETDLAHG